MSSPPSNPSSKPAIGEAITTLSKSYDRIYGLLLGIRVSVSLESAKPLTTVVQPDFNDLVKLDIPREGNSVSPAHKGNFDYKFKSYSPKIFRALRHHFGISDQDFLVSLTSDYMMSELKTIGRSSAMFYYTWDARFLIKTLTKDEMQCLRRILPPYYEYVSKHPDTYVNQFFGAYRSQTSAGRALRFVVLNNVFPVGLEIHLKFDLKGSTVNRSVPPEKQNQPGSTWKEAEFERERYLKIGPHDWELFRSGLESDTNFLAQVEVMDYSLLIGVHKFSQARSLLKSKPGEKFELFTFFTPDMSSGRRYRENAVHVKTKIHKKGGKSMKKDHSKSVIGDLNVIAQILPHYRHQNQRLFDFFGGMRASNLLDEPIEEVYFIGIIDFLQTYTTRKKTEHALKALVYNKEEISCISPGPYASRLYNFIVKNVAPPTGESLIEAQSLEQLSELILPPSGTFSTLPSERSQKSKRRKSQSHRLKRMTSSPDDGTQIHPKKKHKQHKHDDSKENSPSANCEELSKGEEGAKKSGRKSQTVYASKFHDLLLESSEDEKEGTHTKRAEVSIVRKKLHEEDNGIEVEVISTPVVDESNIVNDESDSAHQSEGE